MRVIAQERKKKTIKVNLDYIYTILIILFKQTNKKRYLNYFFLHIKIRIFGQLEILLGTDDSNGIKKV